MAQTWKAKRKQARSQPLLRVTLFLATLQILQDKLQALIAERRSVAGCGEARMAGAKRAAAESFLELSHLECGRAEERALSKGGSDPRADHEHPGHAASDDMRERFFTRFHATRPLTEKLEGPVLPFLMSVGMRSEHADQAYHAMSTLVQSAALKVVGIRWRQERLDRQPLVKVLENLPRVFAMRLEPERQRQLQQARPRFQREGPQPALTCNLDRVRKLEYRLRNPHNACYLNSSATALAWAGVVTDNPAAYGALGATLSAVNSARGVYVPRLLSWMSVLQHWPNLHRQQDAGEFLTFLLGRAKTPACAGFWQARRTKRGQIQVLDGGALNAPLAMPLHGQALQDCTDAWESQCMAKRCKTA